MFLRMIKRRHPNDDNEAGIALVMVVAISAVLTLLVSAAFIYALGNIKKATSDNQWNSALAAAYAGIEEYQSRLAEEPTYLKFGNPASTFSVGSAVSLPPDTNKAFGLGATGTWAGIAGSEQLDSNGNVASPRVYQAEYRYEIDNSDYINTGVLKIRSTGRAGGQTRSIVADLRQQGFVDFLYFTDYEMQDPVVSGKNAATCVKYAWAGRPSSTSSNTCGEIGFGSADVIAGPAHSNDTLRVCDATFKGPVTTAYNPATGVKYTPRDSNGSTCNGQVFELAGYPAYSPVVAMPSTNAQIKRETRSDLTGTDVPRPGCLFTGPTQITLNSNGSVTVRSPWTKATRVSGDPATSGTAPAECGSIADLKTTGGATFTPPANNVLYIQNVPAVSGDPNYWSASDQPNTNSCKGAPDGNFASTPAGNGLGYPLQGEVAATDSYKCRNGDLFLKGDLDGSMTIAAENYVYVIGDVKYKDSSDDILGIIGNNAVWIWNPVNSSGNSLIGGSNRRVDSAILSVAHSFMVQNYTTGGARGILTVNGAIAQKFRGTVRNGANGYTKNYVYDPRLRYTAPPKFLSPVSTTYGVNVWVEVSPVFKASGAAS